MRSLTWPAAARATEYQLSVTGHTRGAPNREGVATFSRGSAARIVGRVSTVALSIADGLAFRAFLHRVRGRAGSFYMAIPGTGYGIATTSVVYTDGTRYTDGTAYSDALEPTKGLAMLSAAASAGAETVSLESVVGPALAAGQWCALGDLAAGGQLVRIVGVSGSTITVRPRLRAALADGTAVRFGGVQGLFRFPAAPPPLSFRNSVVSAAEFEIEEAR